MKVVILNVSLGHLYHFGCYDNNDWINEITAINLHFDNKTDTSQNYEPNENIIIGHTQLNLISTLLLTAEQS